MLTQQLNNFNSYFYLFILIKELLTYFTIIFDESLGNIASLSNLKLVLDFIVIFLYWSLASNIYIYI